jgi:hypothetical protein
MGAKRTLVGCLSEFRSRRKASYAPLENNPGVPCEPR